MGKAELQKRLAESIVIQLRKLKRVEEKG
jgi:hypothetical protein